MLERCSTSRLAKIAQPKVSKPCKEIGTPSLKAVGEKREKKKRKRKRKRKKEKKNKIKRKETEK